MPAASHSWYWPANPASVTLRPQRTFYFNCITFQKRNREVGLMGRKRRYGNAAERLRAFRARAKISAESVSPPTSPERKARVLSRPARLAAAESELHALLDEYQAWRDNLPESLQESGLAVKLDETIDEFTEIVAALAEIDLPKGFGRD